jgi:hypothetical protein
VTVPGSNTGACSVAQGIASPRLSANDTRTVEGEETANPRSRGESESTMPVAPRAMPHSAAGPCPSCFGGGTHTFGACLTVGVG